MNAVVHCARADRSARERDELRLVSKRRHVPAHTRACVHGAPRVTVTRAAQRHVSSRHAIRADERLFMETHRREVAAPHRTATSRPLVPRALTRARNACLATSHHTRAALAATALPRRARAKQNGVSFHTARSTRIAFTTKDDMVTHMTQSRDPRREKLVLRRVDSNATTFGRNCSTCNFSWV